MIEASCKVIVSAQWCTDGAARPLLWCDTCQVHISDSADSGDEFTLEQALSAASAHVDGGGCRVEPT